jgi:hypothetical protein
VDHSGIAELVDAVHVALGLRLTGVVLFQPDVEQGDQAVGLLAIAEDLPDIANDRGAYLERRAPPGSFEGAEITLQTPAEFAAESDALYRRIAAEGRIMLDLEGLISQQLARIRAGQP